jgi:ribonuclease P protein component
MLPKKNRLTKKEILDFLPKSKSLRGNFLLLRFKISDNKDFKAGVSISKKIARTAVVRNKIRRAIYKTLSDDKKNINPSAIFFIVNKLSDTKLLKDDVERLLSEAKLLKA